MRLVAHELEPLFLNVMCASIWSGLEYQLTSSVVSKTKDVALVLVVTIDMFQYLVVFVHSHCIELVLWVVLFYELLQ